MATAMGCVGGPTRTDPRCARSGTVEDVRLAVEGSVPVEFYGRYGGSVPSAAELYDKICALIRKDQEAPVRS